MPLNRFGVRCRLGEPYNNDPIYVIRSFQVRFLVLIFDHSVTPTVNGTDVHMYDTFFVLKKHDFCLVKHDGNVFEEKSSESTNVQKNKAKTWVNEIHT